MQAENVVSSSLNSMTSKDGKLETSFQQVMPYLCGFF